MGSGLILAIRLLFVSGAFVLALGTLSWTHSDSALAALVEFQNRTILISSLVSLGYSSIILYYASRGRRQGVWSTLQMFNFTPIMTAFSITIALVYDHNISNMYNIAAVSFGTVLYTLATAMPSYYIGRGRLRYFAATEILTTLGFALATILAAALHSATPVVVIGLYVAMNAAKCVAYTVGDAQILTHLTTRWNGRPNFVLAKKFGLLSWITGAATALIYRGLLFEVINLGQRVNRTDALFYWSILDRAQNVVQVINTLSFRHAAISKANQRDMAKRSIALYPPIGAACIITLSAAVSVWYWLKGQHLEMAVFLLAPLFLIWGFRSVVQNLLLARRLFAPVISNAFLVLVVAGGGWLAIKSAQLSFASLVGLASVTLVLSSAHLVWSLRRV